MAGNGKKVQGKLTDQALLALAKDAKNLESLDVSQNRGVTYKGALALLKECELLNDLCLERTLVTKEGYKSLKKLRPEVNIDWSK